MIFPQNIPPFVKEDEQEPVNCKSTSDINFDKVDLNSDYFISYQEKLRKV